MGSGAMIYIPNFIKFGLGFLKLIGTDTQIHRQEDGIRVLQERRLKMRLKIINR
jgi:hypothetical protein